MYMTIMGTANRPRRRKRGVKKDKVGKDQKGTFGFSGIHELTG
jgi:hypothetical protein